MNTHFSGPSIRPGQGHRADVVGIFPNEPSITRLIGAVLLEANDEWQLQHRYMQVEVMAELLSPDPDAEPLKLPPKAACRAVQCWRVRGERTGC